MDESWEDVHTSCTVSTYFVFLSPHMFGLKFKDKHNRFDNKFWISELHSTITY